MIKEPEKENNLSFESNEGVLAFLNMGIKEEKIPNEIKKLIKRKFKIKKYYINENGRKRRVLRVRKFKNDDIRKKIKIKFHKVIKNIINKNLKKANSKKFFKFLPSIFTGNISKKLNSKYLEYTYKELLLTGFTLLPGENVSKKVDYNNYLNNKHTIEYLEQNEKISKNSGFDLIKNLKCKDLLNAYFSSRQFEFTILELKNKNETIDYIQEYIRLSRSYLKYFCTVDKPEDSEDKKLDNNNLNDEFEYSFENDSIDDLGLLFYDYKMWQSKNIQ